MIPLAQSFTYHTHNHMKKLPLITTNITEAKGSIISSHSTWGVLSDFKDTVRRPMNTIISPKLTSSTEYQYIEY